MRLYPGIYQMDSLLSKRFQRPGEQSTYHRFDLRIWESDYGRQPRLRDGEGRLLLGDAQLADWRGRAATGAARMRAYYDVIPDHESRMTLDRQRRNAHGDPMFEIAIRPAASTLAAERETEEAIEGVFDRVVGAGGGKLLRQRVARDLYDHPAGGCRMGSSPEDSVVDSYGRTWEHDNLWVVGAPTMPSAGCNNGTLTFSALAIRSAAAIAREHGGKVDAPASVPHRAEVMS